MSKKGLMRNLGQFFGHVVKGITSDPGGSKSTPGAPAPANSAHSHKDRAESANQESSSQVEGEPMVVLRQDVQERTAETSQGRLTMRRTVIDEVRLEPTGADAQAGTATPEEPDAQGGGIKRPTPSSSRPSPPGPACNTP